MRLSRLTYLILSYEQREVVNMNKNHTRRVYKMKGLDQAPGSELYVYG